MDKKYIEDNEIEIKYLRKQLSPAELEEFEVYLMENPQAIDGLELDTLLMEDSSLKSKHKLNIGNIENDVNVSSILGWSNSFVPRLKYAASFFAGIIATVIFTSNNFEQHTHLNVASTVYLETVRSTDLNSEPSIQLLIDQDPSVSSNTLIVIPTAFDIGRKINAQLFFENDIKNSLKISGVTDENGEFMFILPPQLTREGLLSIQIFEQGGITKPVSKHALLIKYK